MSFRPHLNFNIAFLNAAEGHPIIENKLPLKLPKKLLIIFFLQSREISGQKAHLEWFR